MKREFFYKITVEVDEPSKSKDGNEKSVAGDVLRLFEERASSIRIIKSNTALSVKALTPSSPDEGSHNTATEHGGKTGLLLEREKNPNYFCKVRQRLREANKTR